MKMANGQPQVISRKQLPALVLAGFVLRPTQWQNSINAQNVPLILSYFSNPCLKLCFRHLILCVLYLTKAYKAYMK